MKVELGSISSGTLRAEDLFENFLQTIENYWHLFSIEDQRKIEQIVDETLDNQTEKNIEVTLDAFWDILDDLSPKYCYFGANEGDGACYGFWPEWDQIEQDIYDAELVQVDDLSKAPKTGICLLTNDHGNTTLYRMENGEPNEIWSIV